MKKYLPLISAVLITVFFFSCNIGGEVRSEVKLIPVKSGSDFQYIDQEGKIIINSQFSQATVFRNGLALVKSTGNEPQWGYIKEDGKFAIKANYKYATVFSDGLAWVVTENAAPTAINNKGEIIITLQEARLVKIFKEGLSAYYISDSNGKEWGFIDKTGKIKINPQFSITGNFNNGKCAVANQNGKWGYIDTEGKLVINYQFDSAGEFVDGKAVVASGDKTGLIDENGKYLINPQFSYMKIDGDMILISQDGKWGWCDKEGKIIINPQFGAAFPFLGNDLAPVQSGKSYCYIDKEGKIVINPQFNEALPFNGKLAIVSSSNKIGFIDREGKYLINPQFNEVSKDLVTYIRNGSSEYEIVPTDYFNEGIIIDRLKKDITESTVAGINFSTPMSTIFAKYKIQGSPNKYFNYNTQTLQLISGEKISSDAVLDMKIDVIPIIDNPTLNGFYYNIRLQALGFNKADSVMKALETAFNGYTKDVENSRSDYLVLKSNSLAINAYVANNVINVSIVSLEKQNEIEELPGD